MEGKAMDNEDNPRMQCNRCGKWYRLYKNEEQWMWPGCISGDIYVEIYHNICGTCLQELDAHKKDLELAYKAGLEQSNGEKI
jgi:hypothetical protein